MDVMLQKTHKSTLVLDLDETLVHATKNQLNDTDFEYKVSSRFGEECTWYVRRRPYLQTFLEIAADKFEIITFTAGTRSYAEELLHRLDPERKLISRRLYRDSCVFFNDGHYTKDLTVLGLDLTKVVIIDNSPHCYRSQPTNGIPVKSWYSDPSDDELLSLLPFLDTLVDVDDVRLIIAKRFPKKKKAERGPTAQRRPGANELSIQMSPLTIQAVN